MKKFLVSYSTLTVYYGYFDYPAKKLSSLSNNEGSSVAVLCQLSLYNKCLSPPCRFKQNDLKM